MSPPPPIPSPQSTGRPERSESAGGELKAGLNPNSENLFDKLRQTQIMEYSPDTFKGKTRFEAYVVANPFLNGAKPVPGDYGVRVRCRIDKLYKHLPAPNPGEALSCEITTLYPEFTAENLESIGLSSQPTIGTGLTVEFIDRYQTTLQYGNGRIIGPNGKMGSFVSGMKKSPIDKFVQNNCKELERKYNRIKGLNAEKLCAAGDVYDWRKGACLDPAAVLDTIPPPPPETDPVWAPNPECDKSYVLQQVRSLFDGPSDTPAKTLEEIKKKIWWSDASVKAIARLHPAIRDKVINMMVLLVDNPKRVLPSAPGPLYTQVFSTGGFRTLDDQLGIWSKGNLPPGTVLPNGFVVPDNTCVPGTPKCRVVTNATEGESYHNFGLAVDIWPMQKPQRQKPGDRPLRRTPSKDEDASQNQGRRSAYTVPKNAHNTPASHPLWELIGAAGLSFGLDWGKRFKDISHWQIDNKPSLKGLRLKVINGQTNNGYVIL